MAPVDTQEVARRLSERGERGAIATAVWRRGLSSGKAGYRAVQFKAAGGLRGETAASPPAQQATDPVCGMTVDVACARHRLDRGGETYHFCGAGCRERFETSHEEYRAGIRR